MDDLSGLDVPRGERVIAVARADRTVRLLRLGIATTLSLMVVVMFGALFGQDSGAIGLLMALCGAGIATLADMRAGEKVYALTDRHVLVRTRAEHRDIPYAQISGVRRWFAALSLTVETRGPGAGGSTQEIVGLEDLREVYAWEALLKERIARWET